METHERKFRLTEFTEVAGDLLQRVADLSRHPGWLLILRLLEDKKRGLLHDLEMAESDEDLLRCAKDYRLAVQEYQDITWWPGHCEKMLEEEKVNGEDAGRESEGTAGSAAGEQWEF